MKKSLLFALGAFVAMPLFAQEEDVTHYIQNAGFDEDLTFQVDGTMKEAVSTTTSLSERSWAYIAADGTVYARPKSTSSQNRQDGRKMDAVNGFVGQVQGWEVTTGSKLPACEWTYFGTIPYDLVSQAIPIADDGTTYLEVPERPEVASGSDNVGFVYMRAGWGGKATYKQTVKLPCAQYRLEYWAININSGASKGKNLSKIVCRSDTWADETGFNDTEWTLHAIEFTPTSEFTMEFGFESSGGSGSNPFLCIDAIKLYKIADADPYELLESLQNDFFSLQNELNALGFIGVSNEITDIMDNISEAMDLDESEQPAKIEEFDALLQKYKGIVDAIPAFEAVVARLQKILETKDYAGKEAFQAAVDRIAGYIENGTADQILNVAEEAEAVIRDYIFSQVATPETPADYTLLIKNPWFVKPAAEPMLDDYGQYVYENGDSYSVGSGSNEDQTSEGWYISGSEGGDQRLNYQQGRTCWNAWNNNFTSVIGVAQDLENLPNGYYKVTADLITQASCANDQHVFAKSTAEKTISAYLQEENWDMGDWSTLTTTEAALVVDGKLTIGAEGTGTGEGAKGWFLVTNFRLEFLGAADEAAINTKYTAMVDNYNAYANAMHLAVDRKAFQEVVAANTGSEDIVTAMVAMNEGYDEAVKSEAKYLEYLPADETIIEGKTLREVPQTLKSETYGAAQEIMQFAYDQTMAWINGDSATYTKMDATINLLKNYLNTYTPVYNQAAELLATSVAKDWLQRTMNEQKAVLTASMCEKAVIDEYVAELKRIMNAVERQNIYEDANATDYTAFIRNPKAEAGDGWVFEMGNGDGNGHKSGQWYDGSNTAYFDSYHSAGLSGFKGYQIITGLPNGTYSVGLCARTPAEGAYVFTAVSADTAYVEIPIDYYIEETTGEPAIASDKYGPIWDEAKAAVEGGYADDVQTATYDANNGQGRGWKRMEITNVIVTNHELCIGMLAGSIELRKTEKDFGGNWFSTGAWTLTLTAKGDNTGWEGPLADGIETISNTKKVVDGIYTLNGQKVAKMQRGLNIVIQNGKAVKVMVK